MYKLISMYRKFGLYLSFNTTQHILYSAILPISVLVLGVCIQVQSSKTKYENGHPKNDCIFIQN